MAVDSGTCRAEPRGGTKREVEPYARLPPHRHHHPLPTRAVPQLQHSLSQRKERTGSTDAAGRTDGSDQSDDNDHTPRSDREPLMSEHVPGRTNDGGEDVAKRKMEEGR